MKHFTTVAVAALLLASSAVAQNVTTPTGEWAKFVTNQITSGTMTNAIATTEDGSMTYWYGSAATKAAGDQAFFDGEAVFTAPIATERNNNSPIILAINDKGEKVWSAYCPYGDAVSNNGGIVILPDNSIVFVMVVRHDPLALDHAITFVDATGETYDMFPAVTEYRNVAIIGHLSAEGKLLGHSTIDVDPLDIDGTIVRAGITVDGVTATPDGNILIYGNQRADFTYIQENGEPILSRKNDFANIGWDGNAQKDAGDMYMAWLTPEGRITGNPYSFYGRGYTNGHIYSAVYDESGNLYIYGRYTLVEGQEVKGSILTRDNGPVDICSTGKIDLFVARFNGNDNMPKWMKFIIGEKVNNSCIVQNSGLSIGNGNLWLAAQYNGKFYPQGDETKEIHSTLTMREGMLVRFNPENGEWIKGVSSYDSFPANGLSAYQDAIISPKATDKVYVFGYMMNAAVGVFLRSYDVETLKADTDNAWSLVTGVKGDGFNAAVPIAFNIAYAPKTGTAYTDARGRGGMCAAGLPTATSGSAFGIQLAKFQLPQGVFSGVSDIAVDDSDADNANAPVEYYDLQGRRLSDTPAAGLYIRRQGTRVTKVLVR